jgi:hypothetical protein
MIARAQLPLRAPIALDQSAQDRFLQMLPTISTVAHYAFRTRRKDERQELAAEVIANSFVAFVRLVERDKTDFAYGSTMPSSVPRAAVSLIVSSGNDVGGRLPGRPLALFSLARGDWNGPTSPATGNQHLCRSYLKRLALVPLPEPMCRFDAQSDEPNARTTWWRFELRYGDSELDIRWTSLPRRIGWQF